MATVSTVVWKRLLYTVLFKKTQNYRALDSLNLSTLNIKGENHRLKEKRKAGLLKEKASIPGVCFTRMKGGADLYIDLEYDRSDLVVTGFSLFPASKQS